MDSLLDMVWVKPLDGYRISVEFEDGVTGEFDMTPYLDKGVFKNLRDKAVFDRVRVEYGTAVWPGGVDIAPETVYDAVRAA